MFETAIRSVKPYFFITIPDEIELSRACSLNRIMYERGQNFNTNDGSKNVHALM